MQDVEQLIELLDKKLITETEAQEYFEDTVYFKGELEQQEMLNTIKKYGTKKAYIFAKESGNLKAYFEVASQFKKFYKAS